MTVFERHKAAILANAVTKSNVIGMRKALNKCDRKACGHRVGNNPAIGFWETNTLENLIEKHRPKVTGELHDSGLKLLRSPRYAKRFDDLQTGVIKNLSHFQLIRFDRIEYRGFNAVAVFCAVAGNLESSFVFRNVAWQSGGNGPEIQGKDF